MKMLLAYFGKWSWEGVNEREGEGGGRGVVGRGDGMVERRWRSCRAKGYTEVREEKLKWERI